MLLLGGSVEIFAAAAMSRVAAVVKVPPPIGSVKYKALPVVLSQQRPRFLRGGNLPAIGNPPAGCGSP